MMLHPVSNLNNFIIGCYIDTNIVDSILNSMIANDEWQPSDSFEVSGYVLPSINKNKQAFIKQNENFVLSYFSELLKVFDVYKEKYEYSNLGHNQFEIRNFNLQKFNPGFCYSGYHFENPGLPDCITRHLTFMTYLNSIEEAGETEFLYQNLKIKPEKGLTLIWPAQWTHTHRGLVTEETKYIITGWFDYCIL